MATTVKQIKYSGAGDGGKDVIAKYAERDSRGNKIIDSLDSKLGKVSTSDLTFVTGENYKTIHFKEASLDSSSYASIGASGNNYNITISANNGLNIRSGSEDYSIGSSPYIAQLDTLKLSSNQNISFPNKSGTIALSETETTGGATSINIKFWVGTQAQYDSILTKDSNTLYIIK